MSSSVTLHLMGENYSQGIVGISARQNVFLLNIWS